MKQGEEISMSNQARTRTGIVFNASIIFAAILSLATASSLGESLMNYGFISIFVHGISVLVPAVGNISSKTNYTSSASITLALQWIFFPIYFYCLCVNQPPWKKFRFKNGISDAVRRKGVAALFASALCAFMYFLGDIGVFNFSIFRGTIFNSLDNFFLISLPFDGRLGLASAAFLLPLFEALIYWGLICFVCSILRRVTNLCGNKGSRLTS